MQGYYGAATGKGRQIAKTELEKLNLADGELSLEEGVKEAARIIYVAHDDNKDKDFELEMTWVRKDTASQKGLIGNGWIHEEIPAELVEEADTAARRLIDGEEDDESETAADAAAPEAMEED